MVQAQPDQGNYEHAAIHHNTLPIAEQWGLTTTAMALFVILTALPVAAYTSVSAGYSRGAIRESQTPFLESSTKSAYTSMMTAICIESCAVVNCLGRLVANSNALIDHPWNISNAVQLVSPAFRDLARSRMKLHTPPNSFTSQYRENRVV